jgi:multidrug efflux pump subunit AcrB
VKIAFWAGRHTRAILFLLAALVVGGAVGAFGLPVSLFPRVSFPNIRVEIDAGDRPAERMEVEVTRPVEEALRSTPGVRSIRSTTSRGSAQIWATFDWGDDMAAALLQAQSQVNKLLPALPAGTTFDVRRMDPTVFPVIAYSLTSDTRSLSELHDLAEYQLRPILATVNGVARVEVQGGGVEEFRIVVDPARLLERQMTIADVSAALASANVLTAVGHVEERDRLYLIVTDTQFKNANDIAGTVLRASPLGVVRVSDVAEVRTEAAPAFTRTTADGHPAVLFNVYQQPGGNTVAIAKGIRAALAQEQKHIPAGVTITNWYDQSNLIVASAASVRDAVIIGVILAALVLLVFLRDWKITLIAALAVPVVLAVTALVLYALNQSFNMMTLGGMAAAVGLIIDDAIVMSEHIVRRLHARRDANAKETVLRATDEFAKPLSGSSLSTIVIHIPPAFLVGVFGAFFAALSLSMATSLIISFFVTWLAIPVIAARLLGSKKRVAGAERPQKKPGRLYPAVMRKTLAHPWLILLLVVPILALGYLGNQKAKSGFMPEMDEGGFILDYIGPAGASLTESDRLLKQVEQILKDTPEVQTYSRRTGYSLGGDVSESNTGDFFVRLKPFPRRGVDEVKDDVEGRIKKNVPGLDIELAQVTGDLIADLSGNPEPIVVNLYCDDPKTLLSLAPKVKALVEKVPGTTSVESGIRPAGDGLNIQIDRVKAAAEGVDPEVVTQSLSGLVGGTISTQIQRGTKLVALRVWVPPSRINTSQKIGQLELRAPDGHMFPLNRVATFSVSAGQPEITRENLKRMVAVTARINNRDLGSTIQDVRKALDQSGFLPNNVRYTLGGLYEQQQIAFRGLIKVIAAAAALVFLLLLFMYESFRVAACIMFTTLLAMAFVYIVLWLSGTEVNISSLMGMVMIVGNVTEVAIFYYSEYADATSEGTGIDRLIAAGTYRMRAITMTTVAAILALLPLALGIGQGSGMLQPLAIAIIAGLVVQLPLVLLVLPALLAMVGKARPMSSSVSPGV